MIRISGFIISILIFSMNPAAGQVETDDLSLNGYNDTIRGPELRIGINISRPLMHFAETSRFGIEGVADFNIKPSYFAVAEAGFSLRNLDEPTYRLKESGIFLRLGADRNFYSHFNDVVGVGARLGFSLYERSAPFISAEPGYWGEYQGSLPSRTFFRQWAEVIIVLKAEVFTNIFMGWNFRGKVLLLDRGDGHLQNRYIPGFGAGEVKSTAGFDFYIYYLIPLRRHAN